MRKKGHYIFLLFFLFVLAAFFVSGCGRNYSPDVNDYQIPGTDTTTTTITTTTTVPADTSSTTTTSTTLISTSPGPETREVAVLSRPMKICQLVGDYDRQLSQNTQNLTWTRYRLSGTDLGVPFRHKDKTYLLFGDTIGDAGGNGDSIAYSADKNPDDGLDLDFIADYRGVYQPMSIPGISQGEYNVPVQGVSAGDSMYVYFITDSTDGSVNMGRSIVAVSENDGQSFMYLYDFSEDKFINVSIVTIDPLSWPAVPQTSGSGMMIFGSGRYRRSNVYLAYQPQDNISAKENIVYFSGLNQDNQPIWSASEDDALALFDHRVVGELSVSYNSYIRKWIMLYNCKWAPNRGINVRTADNPWGPWSDTQVLFDSWADGGYGSFMHFPGMDNLSDPGRESTPGGEYGPYQFADFAKGNSDETTIYFTMSTWNPYTVVLMKAALGLR